MTLKFALAVFKVDVCPALSQATNEPQAAGKGYAHMI